MIQTPEDQRTHDIMESYLAPLQEQIEELIKRVNRIDSKIRKTRNIGSSKSFKPHPK